MQSLDKGTVVGNADMTRLELCCCTTYLQRDHLKLEMWLYSYFIRGILTDQGYLYLTDTFSVSDKYPQLPVDVNPCPLLSVVSVVEYFTGRSS